MKIKIFTLAIFLLCFNQVGIAVMAMPGVKVVNFNDDSTFRSMTKKGSLPQIDTTIQLMGRPSLSWCWKNGEQILFDGDFKLDYKVDISGIIYAPVFALYIYNEKAIDEQLTFLLRDNTNQEMEFTFGLNFTGWRTAWVRYTDMKCDVEDHFGKTINKITVTAPDKGKGSLKFGPIIPNAKIYQALSMADINVPYISDGEDEHRGPGVSRKHLDVLKLTVDPYVATEKDISDVKEVERRLESSLFTQYRANQLDEWQSLREFYDGLMVGDKAKSPYICFAFERIVLPFTEVDMSRSSVNFQDVGNFLKDLAVIYRDSDNAEQKREIETMFTSLLCHIKLQGWVAGHARGSIHNTGYKIKTFVSAIYLMRDFLGEEGLLSDAKELCQWLTNAKECLLSPHDGDLDYFHTFALEQLLSLLLSEGNNEKVAWLGKFSKFISTRMAMQTNDQMDGYKYDGTAFHHYGHYPAYAIGALSSSSQLTYTLSESNFAVTEEACENLKQALLQMRLYANKYDFPNSLAGRHPFGKSFNLKSEQMENAFYYFSLAGVVDEKEVIDNSVRAAYMRLYPEARPEYLSHLKSIGVSAEDTPQGHWVMNNASNSIHRRDEWLVSIKGYSKYVWNAETWQNYNKYGVFQSNGAIDIMLCEGLEASGYVEAGWDWRKLPGTTSMNAPLEVLNASITGNINRVTTESFVGGVSLDKKQGAFGMVLNDQFFNLKARKSTFCFDNRIICIGSNITSWNQNYDTETTLFQNALTSQCEVSKWNGGNISNFPYVQSLISDQLNNNMLMDNVGNYYLVTKGDLVLRRSTQHSRYHNSGNKNHGDFATAYINHGRHPLNAEYEYAILIQPKDEEAALFHKSFNSSAPAYVLLQHDSAAHAVYDRETGITAAVVYESGQLDIDCVKDISAPALFMLKGDEHEKQFTICQPDLKWGFSRPTTSVYLKLSGEWSVDANDVVEVIYSKRGETLLKIDCEMGKTHSFTCKSSR